MTIWHGYSLIGANDDSDSLHNDNIYYIKHDEKLSNLILTCACEVHR